MLFFSLLLGKISLFLIQKIKGSTGSTWPGHLVIETNRNFIRKVLAQNKSLKIVLIAGTNGKTTTTKALHHILLKSNIKVIRNDAGANLLNGLASILVRESNLSGKIDANALLFEVDENSLPIILNSIKNPDAIILLNLFRDQLDRYGEINKTSEKWMEALGKLSEKTTIIANADDPQIAFISNGHKAKPAYFTVSDDLKSQKTLSHAVDSIVCPQCRHGLSFSKIAYSHIGEYRCPSCSFTNPKSISTTINTSLKGSYNIYNLTAALLASRIVFGVDEEKAVDLLIDFTPAFGRQEIINVDGKKILLLLSKNPTGFNESLKVVKENNYSTLLLLLNDRIPDGRDISWIWDVDFEILNGSKLSMYASGDRTYDLANRLTYASLTPIIEEDVRNALHEAITQTKRGETLAVLPTYSAMLEVRQLLTGRNIL